MGWRNWLEEEVEVVLTVLNQAAEAAYSVQAFDWSGGKGRPEEGNRTRHFLSLPDRATDRAAYKKPKVQKMTGITGLFEPYL